MKCEPDKDLGAAVEYDQRPPSVVKDGLGYLQTSLPCALAPDFCLRTPARSMVAVEERM